MRKITMHEGDPDGIYIVDLKNDPVMWDRFVHEQARDLIQKGKVAFADEKEDDEGRLLENHEVVYYGDLQHPKVQPIYGRPGSPDFQQARSEWTESVLRTMSKMQLESSYNAAQGEGSP